MALTTINNCSCSNEYQDRKYGKGRRVFNEGVKEHTCTVCGKNTGAFKSEKKEPEEKGKK